PVLDCRTKCDPERDGDLLGHHATTCPGSMRRLRNQASTSWMLYMITRSDTWTNAGPWGGVMVRQRRTVELSTCNSLASSSVVYQRPSISLLTSSPRSGRCRLSC